MLEYVRIYIPIHFAIKDVYMFVQNTVLTCLTQVRTRICTPCWLKFLPDAGLAGSGAMMHLDAGVVKMLGKQSFSLFKNTKIETFWWNVSIESGHILGPMF